VLEGSCLHLVSHRVGIVRATEDSIFDIRSDLRESEDEYDWGTSNVL
jgi:hypothetical protein